MSDIGLSTLEGVAVPVEEKQEEVNTTTELLPLKSYNNNKQDEFFSPVEDIPARDIEPIKIEWTNISLSIPLTKPKKKGEPVVYKHILKDISAYANPGEVLAIMGPSGSGKTSLLNVLSGRIPKNAKIEGHVTSNGEKITKAFMKRKAGYVLQDDLLLPYQTVRETLEFSAGLRLSHMSASERIQRVNEVIAEMGLRKVENTFIGNEYKRGVSGGERKRVSVALEVMRDVSVLFLDEPTSGLDSYVALNVVEALKMLAKRHNIAVICTIHQPRSQIWEMFDKLLLLSEGRIMYFGPSNQVVSFFGQAGYECPEHFNPADFFLDLVAVDYRSSTKEKETSSRVQFLGENFVQKKSEKQDDKVSDEVKAQADHHTEAHKPPFLMQNSLLLKRVFLERSRDKLATVFRFIAQVIVALLLGWIYFDLATDQQSIQNRSGLLFFVVVQQGFIMAGTVVDRFITQRAVFKRENTAGYYGSTAYYLSRNLGELPMTVVITVTYGSIIYWMTGLQSDVGKFFIFLLVLVGSAFAGEGLGFFISTISPNVIVANILMPIIVITFLLLSGFYTNANTIPSAFIWLEYISFMKYAYAAVMINEFTGLEFTCDSSSFTNCPISNGEEVLSDRGLDDFQLWVNVMLVFICAFGYRLAGYIMFRRSNAKTTQLPP